MILIVHWISAKIWFVRRPLDGKTAGCTLAEKTSETQLGLGEALDSAKTNRERKEKKEKQDVHNKSNIP